MRAWEEEQDFPSLVREDTAITGQLDAAALDAAFDLDAYTRHVDVVFDRLSTLTRKEEPVHA
jgi:adenylosuccinate lyase